MRRSRRSQRRYRSRSPFHPSTEFRVGKRQPPPERILGKGAMIGLMILAAVFLAGLAAAYWPQDLASTKEQNVALANDQAPTEEKSAALSAPLLEEQSELPTTDANAALGQFSEAFSMCPKSGRYTCVVDGDTFWIRGVKVRVADIDTPEIFQPQVELEKRLGDWATDRLMALLNAGSFELRRIGSRDEDANGRKLRVVVRDGRSLGDQLVSEGLARTWTGRREPWC